MIGPATGVGAGVPTCDSCGAWMQAISSRGILRWRCPWVCAGDPEPEPGAPWYCGRPYERLRGPDSARAFGAASSPSNVAA